MAVSTAQARFRKLVQRIISGWTDEQKAEGIVGHWWYDDPYRIDDEGGYGNPHEETRPPFVVADDEGWIRINK